MIRANVTEISSEDGETFYAVLTCDVSSARALGALLHEDVEIVSVGSLERLRDDTLKLLAAVRRRT